MITDYHIQIIVGKMDELLEVQSAMLSELRRMVKRPPELEQLKQTMENIMEQEQNNIENQQSVTIDDGRVDTCSEPEVSTASENEAPKTKGSAKALSKTQSFKNYRAAGGTLSWNKWKLAGMPLVP